MMEQKFSNNFVGGEGGGHSKCMESFIDEFSPNMVKYSFED